ncbi:MAG: hypothetical protein V4481_02380 [Patescibacteria group bacterium]
MFIFFKKNVTKLRSSLTIGALLILTATILIPSHLAHAGLGDIIGTFLGYNTLWEFITSFLAIIASIALSIASWFVALAGTLLNVSINITLHIKELVHSTPAIYDVWKIIRDVSGLFIIFALLYAAIQLILGISRPNFGDLIKNIVVAGILINFSFFMTGVLIDASNVVSLALYRAMVPGQPDIGRLIENGGSNVTAQVGAQSQAIVKALFNDGGLSAIFMQSLQIQSSFDPKKFDLAQIQGGGAAAALKIVLIAVTGVIIMITAGLSFLAASLAFIIRLFILIFLLAFSPILFAAKIVPKIGEYGKDWWNMLQSQLIFMPVYLLLMYVALTILSKTNIFNSGAYGGLWQGGATSSIAPTEFIVLGINAAFVIIMLNIPLIAAFKLGGVATEWVSKSKLGQTASKWGSKQIWSDAGAGTYKGTVGRGASWLARSETFKDIASRSPVAGTMLRGVRGVAGDYDKKLSEQVKARTEFADSLGHDVAAVNKWESRLRSLKLQRDRVNAEPVPADPRLAALQADQKRELKNDIDDTERIISEQKNRRKQSYANETNQGSKDTLWTKVARKNKKAAAAIQAGIYEDRLKGEEDDLKDVKADLKALENAIRNNPADPANNRQAGQPNPEQTRELNRLTAKRNTSQEEVNKIKNWIANEKLTASK